MPAHQPHHVQSQPAEMPKRQATGSSAAPRISDDIRAINSSILIISQKLKFLVRNEKILGRNLLVINKKVKDLQETRQQGVGVDTTQFEREFSLLNSSIAELNDKVASLQSEVENIKQNYAKGDQLAQMKYVVDSINPLEFATVKDLAQLRGEKKKVK